MEEFLACYRFECPKYPTCLQACGMGCCLEHDPQQKRLPEGACTKENGYPYYREKPVNPVHAWLRKQS
jgi:hypothetical protein